MRVEVGVGRDRDGGGDAGGGRLWVEEVRAGGRLLDEKPYEDDPIPPTPTPSVPPPPPPPPPPSSSGASSSPTPTNPPSTATPATSLRLYTPPGDSYTPQSDLILPPPPPPPLLLHPPPPPPPPPPPALLATSGLSLPHPRICPAPAASPHARTPTPAPAPSVDTPPRPRRSIPLGGWGGRSAHDHTSVNKKGGHVSM